MEAHQLENESEVEFKRHLMEQLNNHPIVANNTFTKQFETGDFSLAQLELFTVQFSVFSNLFLVAQLKKTLNAPTLSSQRKSKEILANEIGVSYKTNGSIEGGRFQFRAAHFEWLLDFAESVGLKFQQLGRRGHGSATTLHFTDTLENLLGSEDPSISAGASFALENWAANGFWKELINGLNAFSSLNGHELNIKFFTFHDAVEDTHAQHTHEELCELLAGDEFQLDKDKFQKAGLETLDALKVFWEGLKIKEEISLTQK
jgi:hypothetical protein